MTHSMNFETWKSRLREDCEKDGKLAAFEALGDYVLKLLWKSGIEPSVRAICNDGAAFERSEADNQRTFR